MARGKPLPARFEVTVELPDKRREAGAEGEYETLSIWADRKLHNEVMALCRRARIEYGPQYMAWQRALRDKLTELMEE